MAGHSHAKNVMHQKSVSDAKKGKIFNKLAREIMVSAKQGLPDPDHNPRLRSAILAARKQNLPRERIERAIKAGTPGATDGADYKETRYEGYGPGGIALIVECLTDNATRTVSELRTAFSKGGGAIGESGSVAFMFNHVGQVVFPAKVASADAMLEAVIEAGGENVDSSAEWHDVTMKVENFGAVRDALEKKFGEPESAKLVWLPQSRTPLSGEPAQNLLKLIDALEENDDVQTVTGNYNIPEEELAKMAS